MEAGVQMGLTRDVSRTLVVETMAGLGRPAEGDRAATRGAAGRGDLAGGHHGGGHPDAWRRGRCARPSWRRSRRRRNGRATCSAERIGPTDRAERTRPHRLLPLGLRDAGRVRRGRPRGHRGRRAPGRHRHRPDPPRSRPSTSAPGATPWCGPSRISAPAWCWASSTPGSARRGAASASRSRSPPAGPCTSSGPTTGCWWRRPRPAGEAPDRPAWSSCAGDAAARRRPGRHLRRARPLRPGGGGAVRRRRARGRSARRSTRLAGPPDRRGGRAGAPARRPGLPARRGDLGRPLRQPPAGGDRGRRPVAGLPAGGQHRAGGAGIERATSTLDGAAALAVPEGMRLRCVDAFGELKHGRVRPPGRRQRPPGRGGREASAASWLNVTAGELVVLAW